MVGGGDRDDKNVGADCGCWFVYIMGRTILIIMLRNKLLLVLEVQGHYHWANWRVSDRQGLSRNT